MKERPPSRGGTGGRGHPGLRGQPEPSQTWMVQGGGEREGAAVPQCWIAEGATMMRRRSFCWNRELSEQCAEIERVGQTGCVAGA